MANLIINDAIGKKKDLYMLSLDIRDAFGSIPHDLIKNNLLNIGIPSKIGKIILDSYKDATIKIKTRGGTTAEIKIGKGVKQGCPLSPTLFNLGIDPLLRYLKKDFEMCGYPIMEGRRRKVVQAYADDLLIFTESRNNLNSIADAIVVFMKYAKINFNSDKCRLIIHKQDRSIEVPFLLED
jgi:hypothetical protein